MTSSDIFEGIAAVSQLGMLLVVGAGVWVAYCQLHAWRDQDAHNRGVEVAEDLLFTALAVSDALRSLRSPMDRVPKDLEGDRQAYIGQKRLERFQDFNDLFEKLRTAEARATVVLDNPVLKNSTDTLFRVRAETATAIEMLSDPTWQDESQREFRATLRSKMYGQYSEKWDPLGMEQLAAIQDLHNALAPIIQKGRGHLAH